MRKHVGLVAPLLFVAALLVTIVPARAADAERPAFYKACVEPDPGLRFRNMAAFLETYPDASLGDRVRTLLFGVAASGGWKEGKAPLAAAAVGEIVSREAERYLRGGEDPDRLLLLGEAYLRSGVRTAEAIDLARRGGALAQTMERPADTPVSSWGRIKKERIARSNYIAGLAEAAAGESAAAVESFRRAEPVFRSDPRFREEYARAVAAAGGGKAAEPSVDERSAAMEAMSVPDPAERIAKLEEYLRLFPEGAEALEIRIRLVEEYAKTPARQGEAVAAAEAAAAGSEDPEVLSALALLLADAGVGTDRAVVYGARATNMVEKIVRDPATDAADLPAIHADLLLVRDAYGWALLKSGRKSDAVAQLKKAAESEYPEVEYHYGAALLETGDSFDAAGPLVNAALGGSEEAWAALEKIRGEDSALRAHVDDLLDRGEQALRRRKLAEEKPWPAPEFSLVSLDGKVVASSALQGHVAVLVFWATWCEPCRDELPIIQKVADTYQGKDVRFLAVSTDRDMWLVKPFLEDQGIRLETVLTAGETDWEETARAFQLNAIPSLLVIDRKGNVRFAEGGYEGGARLFEKALSWRLDKVLGER